jgi:hypothetical protein
MDKLAASSAFAPASALLLPIGHISVQPSPAGDAIPESRPRSACPGTPRGLEIGPGLLEGRRRATCAFPRMTAGIKTARPASGRLIARAANPLGRHAHPDLAIEDQPAFLAGIGRSAAGESGHAALKRHRAARTSPTVLEVRSHPLQPASVGVISKGMRGKGPTVSTASVFSAGDHHSKNDHSRYPERIVVVSAAPDKDTLLTIPDSF